MARMKAVAKTKPAAGFEIIEAPVPKLASHEVLVEIKACSICGSDVHLYQWDSWAQTNLTPPCIVGHEGAGVVVEAGKQVKHIRVGDRVALESHIPCQKCSLCATGQMHLCRNLQTIGFGRDGCFAEYIAIPEICCVKIGNETSWELGSIHEPLGNSVYAVSESDVAGKTVAVFGDGPTGLFAAAVARSKGAARIFAVGASPYRMEMMKKLGPDLVVDATKGDVVEILTEKTKGEGVDVVLEMSGDKSAIHNGFRLVRNGGTFTAFGIPSGPLEIDFAQEIILKGIKILAIHGRRMFETWKTMLDLLESGRLDVMSVITHRLPLEQIEQAMQILAKKPATAGKIILVPKNLSF